MTDFKVFNVEYGGKEYRCQFDFDALRRADEAGIMEMAGKQPMAFAVNVFYFSVFKHHPHANRSKVFELAYQIIEDEEYGLHAFDEISEDFLLNFTKYVDDKDQAGKKRKTFTAVETSKVVNAPKSEK